MTLFDFAVMHHIINLVFFLFSWEQVTVRIVLWSYPCRLATTYVDTAGKQLDLPLSFAAASDSDTSAVV